MSAKIGIIMGSDSDLPVMKDAAAILDELNIPYELTICSAHRTPERLEKIAKTAEERGLKVLICAAGGAAHLAGVTAAMTALPVIGVPMYSKSVGGMDALLATVQMPPGIPVATVGIGAAKNAGLMAAKILATSEPEVMAALKNYKQKLADQVNAKAEKIEAMGYKAYLEQM